MGIAYGDAIGRTKQAGGDLEDVDLNQVWQVIERDLLNLKEAVDYLLR